MVGLPTDILGRRLLMPSAVLTDKRPAVAGTAVSFLTRTGILDFVAREDIATEVRLNDTDIVIL